MKSGCHIIKGERNKSLKPLPFGLKTGISILKGVIKNKITKKTVDVITKIIVDLSKIISSSSKFFIL